MMTDEELDGMRVLLSVCPGSLDVCEVGKTLLGHIDDQATQIATLKAICKNERLRYNELLREQCDGYGPQYDTEEFAAHELAQDYPEIAWEEKE